MNTLKGSSLKLWLYFNKNQEQYSFELSRAACLEWGIKKDSYYDGIKELMEKGYLIQTREGSNYYTFYESPQTEKPNSEKPNNYFTEEPKDYSDRQKNRSGKQNGMSEKQYRNNINNTGIRQDNIFSDLSERERNELKRLGFIK